MDYFYQNTYKVTYKFQNRFITGGKPKMKNLKIMSIVLILLLGLVSLTAVVSAQSDDYEIMATYMSGVELDASGITAISAELGEDVDISVEVYGDPSGEGYVDNVQVKAWIGGYEYGDVEDTTGPFDVEEYVTYIKKLSVELPKDFDVCFDENDYDECTYTLYVEVYDGDNYEQEGYTFFLERPRHYVDVLDVIVDSDVEAGELAKVEVRLENLGESKEDDIKVTLSIEDLGVTESGYIDELAAPEEDNGDEESSDSINLYLEIPEDATTGDYELTLNVLYDRGHRDVEEQYSIFVEAVGEEAVEEEEEVEEEGEVSVSVSSEGLNAVVGEEAVYTVTFSNGQEESRVFTVDVLGEDQWGSVSVEPSVILVKGNGVEEVEIHVTPNEEGDFDFTLQILDEDDKLVEEVSVDLTSEKASGTPTWLKVLFIAIVVLVIIVILVVAFRGSGDEDDDLDLDNKDGETYY